MRRTLSTNALLILCTFSISAQTPVKRPPTASPQARQEELAKVQELLSDPDPNARLANMEAIVNSEDTTRIQLALRIVFHSDDQNMRALGVRAYVASLKELTFDAQLPPQIQRQYDEAQGEADKVKELFAKYAYVEALAGSGLRVRLVFSKYDMTKGTGAVASNARGVGSFTISGDRVIGNAVVSFPSINSFNCSFDFRPAADMSLKGTLTCENYGRFIFPRIPISAPIF
jgi:hypothetical protein